MKGALAANLGLVATMLVWGTPLPLLDDLLRRWDPFGMLVLRYGIALPPLLLLLWLTRPQVFRRGRFLPPGLTLGRLFSLGGFGIACFAMFFLLGLAYGNPITIAILSAASPLIAALIGWLFYRERPARGIGLALVLALAGGILIGVDFREASARFAFDGGEPLMLIAMACWAWYSITAQRWIPQANQLHLTTITILPAMPIVLAFYLVARVSGLAQGFPSDPTASDLGLIVWIAVSSIVLGVVTWNLGVKHLGAVVASMYLNFVPLIAVLTAVALGVEPRLEQLIGGALVLAGVLQAQLRRLAAPRRPRPAGS